MQCLLKHTRASEKRPAICNRNTYCLTNAQVIQCTKSDMKLTLIRTCLILKYAR